MGSIWKLIRENVIFGKCQPPNKTELPFPITPSTAKEEKGWTVGRGQGEASQVIFQLGCVQ